MGRLNRDTPRPFMKGWDPMGIGELTATPSPAPPRREGTTYLETAGGGLGREKRDGLLHLLAATTRAGVGLFALLVLAHHLEDLAAIAALELIDGHGVPPNLSRLGPAYGFRIVRLPISAKCGAMAREAAGRRRVPMSRRQG